MKKRFLIYRHKMQIRMLDRTEDREVMVHMNAEHVNENRSFSLQKAVFDLAIEATLAWDGVEITSDDIDWWNEPAAEARR